LGGLLEDHAAVFDLIVGFVKFSEFHPEGVEFADGQFGVHGLYGFGVGVDDFVWFAWKNVKEIINNRGSIDVLVKKNLIFEAKLPNASFGMTE
jgi:hypothetical protein